MARKVGKLAKRYARALVDAVEKGDESASAVEVAQALTAFSKIWEDDPKLSVFVLSPMYPKEERLAALGEVVKVGNFPESIGRFVEVLFERDRIAAISEIGAAFAELADQRAGVIHVSVTTARDVPSEEVQHIEKGIASAIKGEPRFFWKVDAEILGGLVVSYGGKVLDGSLSGQLNRMESSLME